MQVLLRKVQVLLRGAVSDPRNLPHGRRFSLGCRTKVLALPVHRLLGICAATRHSEEENHMANGPAMAALAGAGSGGTMDCATALCRDPAIAEDAAGTADVITEVRREEALLKTGALQNAIFNSANFSSIATDEKGVIQIFNVGAERMLGYAAADV